MTDVPSTLLRFFGEREHAHQFIAGQIRFGLLTDYRKVEDARQDDQEGRVSFYWNVKAPQIVLDVQTGLVVGRGESDQNIHYSGFSLNPRFILSTCHPDVDRERLTQKFGRFVVRINDPSLLLQRIKLEWQKHPWALDDSAFLAPVTYNKDGIVEADPYLIAPPHYSYSQKPQSFEEEREFRYVLTCSVDVERVLPDFVVLFVSDCAGLLILENEADDPI
jgi:hypothetical protein